MNIFELFAKISLDDSEFKVGIEKAKDSFTTLDGSAEEASGGVKEAEDSLKKLDGSAEEAGKALDGIAQAAKKTSEAAEEAGDATKEAGEAAEEAAYSTDTLANKIKMIEGLYEKAQAEVERLSRAFNESADKTGAASDETVALAAQLAKAEKAAETYSNALDEVDRELKNTESASEGASGGLEGLIGKMQGAIIKGQLMAKAIEGTIGILIDMAKWVWSLDDTTEEYRIAQGKLTTAFKSAGHTTEEAKETYEEFYKILGDTDTATEASQLLAKLASNQEEMQKWTKISAGVYGTFGDSLPINGLIEAANETAKVGQVTGVLADALNWAGISEDAFNESLKACSTESERNQLITETLSQTYSNAAGIFAKNNEQLIKHRENEIALQESTAKLGEKMGEFKDNILAKLTPHFVNAMEKGTEFIDKIARAFEETGIVESFGAVLDTAIMLLEPLGDLIEIALPALAAAMKPVATILAVIADTAEALIGILEVLSIWNAEQGFTRFNTAMGLNAEYGMLSHQQQLYYKDALQTNVYDAEKGAWVGNYSTVNNYNMTVDASSIQSLNDMARVAQNQRIATRMGVS